MRISHETMNRAIKSCGHLWMTSRDLYLSRGGDGDGFEELLESDRTFELFTLFSESLISLQAVRLSRWVVFDLANSQYSESRNGVSAEGLVAFSIYNGECTYAMEIADLYHRHLIEEVMRAGRSISDRSVWPTPSAMIFRLAVSPL
jgi:hypothetical protein